MDQFFNKAKREAEWARNYQKSTDAFLMSSTFSWPLSFGKEKFNFDIIPYYMLPFWKVNFSNFNKDINDGYEKAYSKSEMSFSPRNSGVMIRLCFPLSGT
jgi:hypothetical protein